MKTVLISVTLLMGIVIHKCLATGLTDMLSRRLVDNLSEKRCDLLGTATAINQCMYINI